MIFRIRRYSAMEAPRGPKMALKRPKMVPRLPQYAPRRPQERPKRVSGRLKMAQERPTRAPRRLQEGSKKGPKRVPSGTSGSSWLRDLSRNTLGPSQTPPGSFRDRPGPLWGSILRPIWTLKMDPRRATQYVLEHICQTAQHV